MHAGSDPLSGHGDKIRDGARERLDQLVAAARLHQADGCTHSGGSCPGMEVLVAVLNAPGRDNAMTLVMAVYRLATQTSTDGSSSRRPTLSED